MSMKFASASTPCEVGFSFGEVEDYCVNILEGNGCYQTPLTISDITDSGAIASWISIDSAASYNVRYREIGTTTWTEVNTAGTTLALDLLGCTFYEVQIQTLCGGGLSSDYGFSTEFITFGCGNCLDLTYCVGTDPNPLYNYIDNVTLNTLDNTSGNDNGYGDFTGPFATSLEQGLTYDITLTAAIGNFEFNRYYTAYIDFNADGDFDDPYEKVMDSQDQLLDLTYTQNFPVPPTAVVGTTRLRVMIENFQTTPIEPCTNFLLGEFEDYCIEITEGTGCYLPLLTEVTEITDEAILITWEDGLAAESFSIQYREIGTTPWIEIDGITGDFYVLADLEGCTEYEFQIKTNCLDISTDWSNIISFKTFGCGACFDYTYCEAIATTANDDNIEVVSMANLDNTSGNNGGYINFEDDFGFIIRPDSTYELYLEPNWPGFMYNVAWGVWIDYNSDGDFDEANEFIFQAPSSTMSHTTSVTVPGDAVIGLTKMRVVMREGIVPNPCTSFTFGEIEDYCVTIQPVVLPCLQPENQDTTDVSTFSAKMIWEMDQYETAIGYVIRYKDVDETEWTELSTEEPFFEAFGLDACRDYEYQVRSVCPQDLSEYTESFFFSTVCFSDTEELLETEDISALKVYPNPFKDRIQVDFQLESYSDLNVQLLNVSGQLIQLQEFFQLPSGTHHLEIQETNLSAGIYFLRIATDNEVVIRKIIKG